MSAEPKQLTAVRDGQGLLFTFFSPSAQMQTVDHSRDVPQDARKAVMVVDPTHRLPQGKTYVADLSQVEADGSFRAWIEARGAWLDRAMPKVSVVDDLRDRKSARSKRPRKRRRSRAASRPRRTKAVASARAHQPGSIDDRGESREVASVVLFGTSWCPSCRLARRYFASQKIRAVEFDVEKDPQAGERMVAIQRARGMKLGAVPLIVINGTAYQGFSRLALDGAIAAARKSARL